MLGGRHGEFKFLPPPGYAPCFEAVLPKEKLKVEHSREYKQDRSYTRDLLGPTVSLSQAAFTPVPVDTSQVWKWKDCMFLFKHTHRPMLPYLVGFAPCPKRFFFFLGLVERSGLYKVCYESLGGMSGNFFVIASSSLISLLSLDCFASPPGKD